MTDVLVVVDRDGNEIRRESVTPTFTMNDDTHLISITYTLARPIELKEGECVFIDCGTDTKM